MSNYQTALELNKQNVELMGKLCFMLITAATASIAYILSQLKNETWNELILFPMYSLTLLAASFILGCSSLNNQLTVLNINSYALQLTGIKDSQKVVKEMYDEIAVNLNRGATLRRFQYLTFIFGALTYAIYVFLSIFMK